MRLRFLNLLLVVCLAVPPALTEDRGPIPPTFFGFDIMRHKPEHLPTVPFGTLRLWDNGNHWKNLNPSPGNFDFHHLDEWLDYARQHHLEVMYTFGHTPPWANGTGRDPDPPKNLQSWDDYVKAITTHAKGRIKYYGVWNEPNAENFWHGSVQGLVTMTQHARSIIQSVDPEAKIVSPEPAGGKGPTSKAPPFLEQFFAAGGGSAIDIVGFHGYLRNYPPETILDTVSAIRASMARHGIAALPIFDSEGSWGKPEECNPPDQTAYLARHYLLHASAGVDRYIWYSYDNEITGTLWSESGGLSEAGKAYGELYNWMVGATLGQPCAASGDTWTCGFNRSNGYWALAVWKASGNGSYSPDPKYKQFRDLKGNVTPINGPITIGVRPIWLETGSAHP